MNLESRVVGGVLLLGGLTGCASALHVRTGDGDKPWQHTSKVQGIPFYTRVAVFYQSTGYERSWFQLSLGMTIKTGGEKGTSTQLPALTRLVPLTAHAEVAELEQAMVLATITNTGFDSLVEQFEALPDTTGQVSVEMVSNKIEETSAIDYDRPYYLNAPLPWFGSANVTGKLTESGVLSEASSQVKPVGLGDIAAIVPAKEVIVAKLTAAAAKQASKMFAPEIAGSVNSAASLEMTLTKVHQGFVYIFSRRTWAYPVQDGTLEPLPFNVRGGQFVRTRLEEKPAQAAKDTAKVTAKSP